MMQKVLKTMYKLKETEIGHFVNNKFQYAANCIALFTFKITIEQVARPSKDSTLRWALNMNELRRKSSNYMYLP